VGRAEGRGRGRGALGGGPWPGLSWGWARAPADDGDCAALAKCRRRGEMAKFGAERVDGPKCSNGEVWRCLRVSKLPAFLINGGTKGKDPGDAEE